MFKHYSLKGFDNSMHLVILVAELLPLYSIHHYVEEEQ
jgi:hypothetical protein